MRADGLTADQAGLPGYGADTTSIKFKLIHITNAVRTLLRRLRCDAVPRCSRPAVPLIAVNAVVIAYYLVFG